jgi:hypothetical protein
MDFWKQEVLRGGPGTPNARLQGDFLAPNRRLKGALRPPIEKVSANTGPNILEAIAHSAKMSPCVPLR